jgi:hypothetical protein
MTTRKQILKFNIVMGIALLVSVLYVIASLWGTQVYFLRIFILYGSYDFVTGKGTWIINFPLYIFIADLLGNIYLWSNLPRPNKGLPTDDLRF